MFSLLALSSHTQRDASQVRFSMVFQRGSVSVPSPQDSRHLKHWRRLSNLSKLLSSSTDASEHLRICWRHFLQLISFVCPVESGRYVQKEKVYAPTLTKPISQRYLIIYLYQLYLSRQTSSNRHRICPILTLKKRRKSDLSHR